MPDLRRGRSCATVVVGYFRERAESEAAGGRRHDENIRDERADADPSAHARARPRLQVRGANVGAVHPRPRGHDVELSEGSPV